MFVPGQRWISSAEPELGLGTVLRVDQRMVQVLYAKAGILRPYAIESAPLRRAEFRAGQRVAGKGIAFLVERVEVRGDILVYRGEGRELEEGQLDDEQSASRADERLVGGRVDGVAEFELRRDALERRAAARRSPTWGLASARIGLIAHQLRVAGIASARHPPRVLLADEVGLGKTIEAGMIIARQLATGRASRVLLLLPDALVYQWFVEMLRRFNLSFAIYDKERCEGAAGDGSGDAAAVNPFEDEQLVIAGFGFIEGAPKQAAQLKAAPWDLLVVDEAHHLAWTPEAASPRYTLVEELAAAIPGVLLLTATPEQLGRSGHFARLRLLDRQRYTSLEDYLAEAETWQALSAIGDRLLTGESPDDAQRVLLERWFGDDDALRARLAAPASPENARELLAALIDRHGTGRVMFRSTRASVGGFPERIPHWHRAAREAADDDTRQRLLAEFRSDIAEPPTPIEPDYAHDPRLPLLLSLLEQHPEDKFLLLCRSQAKVLALEEALRTRSGVRVARFHEGLGLVQRDRNAAYFAQADGARLLLCAEVGAEGRNFQFAHRLILWDLPLDPDLLEQRIGRLDRIGQRHAVDIHLLIVEDSAQHVLARWYDEGINAFRESPADARDLVRRLAGPLTRLAERHARGAEGRDQELDALLAETRASHREATLLVRRGRDHLLELAASRDPHADELGAAFAREDADPARDAFTRRLLEAFGVHAEDLGGGITVLDPQYLSTDALRGFANGPMSVTFARDVALGRDDLPLLRLDHPLIVGALDLVLSNERGNAAFLVDDELPGHTALLQAVFVLECVADRRLDVGRFLAAEPVVATVDTRLVERQGFRASDVALQRARSRNIDHARYRKVLARLVPPMLERARTIAEARAQALSAAATDLARGTLDAEIGRLRALHAVNPSVTAGEIATLEGERDAIVEVLPTARLRLDAVCFIVSPDFLLLR